MAHRFLTNKIIFAYVFCCVITIITLRGVSAENTENAQNTTSVVSLTAHNTTNSLRSLYTVSAFALEVSIFFRDLTHYNWLDGMVDLLTVMHNYTRPGEVFADFCKRGRIDVLRFAEVGVSKDFVTHAVKTILPLLIIGWHNKRFCAVVVTLIVTIFLLVVV